MNITQTKLFIDDVNIMGVTAGNSNTHFKTAILVVQAEILALIVFQNENL